MCQRGVEMNWIIFWLCLMGVAMLIEMFTSTYITVWFAAGGAVAAIVAALGLEWYYQIPVFIVVSIILLFTIRPFFKNFMENGKFEVKSPEERILGKVAVLTEDISEETGHVFLEGKLYRAKVSEGQEPLMRGSIIEVTAVEEGILVVKEAEKVKEDTKLIGNAQRRKRKAASR